MQENRRSIWQELNGLKDNLKEQNEIKKDDAKSLKFDFNMIYLIEIKISIFCSSKYFINTKIIRQIKSIFTLLLILLFKFLFLFLLINLVNLFDSLILLFYNIVNLVAFTKRLRMYYLFKFSQLLTLVFSGGSVQIWCDWFYVLPRSVEVLNQCIFVFIRTWTVFYQAGGLFFYWTYRFFCLVLLVLWIHVFVVEWHWYFRKYFQGFIQSCIIGLRTF